ncbi:hypothetical protein B5X24_HaOG204879 [Helicoverpa armigera]|uniref:Uncharacterized protein n=1 Tax=Helicoverpa armigera TaxID=29058 RepID=A0A2W1BMB3_HELAM|nr:hypothetical protein B5X24_HaOG204879 [Helicoverpa armigera]
MAAVHREEVLQWPPHRSAAPPGVGSGWYTEDSVHGKYRLSTYIRDACRRKTSRSRETAMIRVACLLLVAARALPAASAPTPAPAALGVASDHLLARTLGDIKGNAPTENPVDRKQFIVKLHCKDPKKCAPTQLYEFNLLRVQPSESGKRVYY